MHVPSPAAAALFAMTVSIILLLASAGAIYLACELFVNGIEWVGRRLSLGETATGTVLAAFGTALPESVVTLVATAFGRADAQRQIGIGAALGGPLSEALRELTAAGPADDWSRATGLGRLTDACAPLSGTHRLPGAPEAAALRAVALALAGGATVRGDTVRGDTVRGATAQGTDAPGVLRSVAATVTLVENREKGEATAGEGIVLALV